MLARIATGRDAAGGFSAGSVLVRAIPKIKASIPQPTRTFGSRLAQGSPAAGRLGRDTFGGEGSYLAHHHLRCREGQPSLLPEWHADRVESSEGRGAFVTVPENLHAMISHLAMVLIARTLELGLSDGEPEVSVEGLFPPHNTVVPANAAFRVFDFQLDTTLQRELDGVLTPVEIDWGVSSRLREPGRVDMGPLNPGDVLNAVVSCEDCQDSEQVSWTVASDEDNVAPAYADEEPRTQVTVADQSPRRWGVRICLPPLVSDEPAFHVLVHDGLAEIEGLPNNNSCRIDSDDGTGPGAGFFTKVDAFFGPSEYCFTARVTDAAGNEGELQETCVPLESDEEFEGCGQTRSASTGSLLVAVLILRTRRRAAGRVQRPEQPGGTPPLQ